MFALWRVFSFSIILAGITNKETEKSKQLKNYWM